MRKLLLASILILLTLLFCLFAEMSFSQIMKIFSIHVSSPPPAAYEPYFYINAESDPRKVFRITRATMALDGSTLSGNYTGLRFGTLRRPGTRKRLAYVDEDGCVYLAGQLASGSYAPTIYKVNIRTLTLVSSLSLSGTDAQLYEGVLSADKRYSYWTAIASSGGKMVYKVDMQTFTEVGSVIAPSSYHSGKSIEIDETNGYLYVLHNSYGNFYITRISLTTLTVVDRKTLTSGDSAADLPLIIKSGNYLFCITARSPFKLIRTNLPNIDNTITATIPTTEHGQFFISSNGNFIYTHFISNVSPYELIVRKYQTSDLVQIAGSPAIATGESSLSTALCLDEAAGFIFASRYTKMLKFNLDDLSFVSMVSASGYTPYGDIFVID